MKYNKTYAEHFAKNLRELREAKGLSIRKLSKEVGVAPQTIDRYEYQGSMPDILIALSLADFFGVTLDELIRPKE